MRFCAYSTIRMVFSHDSKRPFVIFGHAVPLVMFFLQEKEMVHAVPFVRFSCMLVGVHT